MSKAHLRTETKKWRGLALFNLIVNFGYLCLVLVILVVLVDRRTGGSPTFSSFITSIAQRDIAIDDAQKKGLTTYSFESNGFVPGLGMVGDSDAVLQDWQKQQESNQGSSKTN